MYLPIDVNDTTYLPIEYQWYIINLLRCVSIVIFCIAKQLYIVCKYIIYYIILYIIYIRTAIQI